MISIRTSSNDLIFCIWSSPRVTANSLSTVVNNVSVARESHVGMLSVLAVTISSFPRFGNTDRNTFFNRFSIRSGVNAIVHLSFLVSIHLLGDDRLSSADQEFFGSFLQKRTAWLLLEFSSNTAPSPE